jgi:bifunctional non-homologous end joining protein LigD
MAVTRASIKQILNKLPKSPMPKNIIPMAMATKTAAFDNEDWYFEIKWDGFRTLAYISNGTAELKSRNKASFNKRFPLIKLELEKHRLKAVLDGEIVLLNSEGKPNFSGLMNGDDGLIVYYVFDILWLNGKDLTQLHLHNRKQILKNILPISDVVRYCDHVEGSGIEMFKLATEYGLEGIVAKNSYSRYYTDIRSSNWTKIKCRKTANVHITGLLLDKDKKGSGFNSLIIGVKTGNEYKYRGLVQAGVTKRKLTQLLTNCKRIKKPIFKTIPPVNARVPFRDPIKNFEVIWLKPYACKIRYLEIDEYNMMRHASLVDLKS